MNVQDIVKEVTRTLRDHGFTKTATHTYSRHNGDLTWRIDIKKVLRADFAQMTLGATVDGMDSPENTSAMNSPCFINLVQFRPKTPCLEPWNKTVAYTLSAPEPIDNETRLANLHTIVHAVSDTLNDITTLDELTHAIDSLGWVAGITPNMRALIASTAN